MTIEENDVLSNLKGQAYVKGLSDLTLRMVEINHKQGMPYLAVDLAN
jgi:hypothetical protein